jgi:hypothetical protein
MQRHIHLSYDRSCVAGERTLQTASHYLPACFSLHFFFFFFDLVHILQQHVEVPTAQSSGRRCTASPVAASALLDLRKNATYATHFLQRRYRVCTFTSAAISGTGMPLPVPIQSAQIPQLLYKEQRRVLPGLIKYNTFTYQSRETSSKHLFIHILYLDSRDCTSPPEYTAQVGADD